MKMSGALCQPETSFEALLQRNCSHNSFFRFGSSMLPKKIDLVPLRARNFKRVAVRSSLAEAGSSVASKEFEFKPSFAEYLKAMESVKMDRDKAGDNVNVVSTPRKKNGVKKIVQEGNDEGIFISDNALKGGYGKSRAMSRLISMEDSNDEETAVKEVKKKLNGVIKKIDGKLYDDYDAEISERAAFSSVDSEDGEFNKKRVTKADKEDRIQKLAKCINGAHIDIPEWQFSKMMRSAQIRYTDYSIMRLVQILGMFGNWRRVLQVIDWMRSHERFKSHKLRYVYTSALTALGKARRPVEALNLFYAMLDQMSSYPDIVAYHSIAVTLGQAGHIKELFDVIDVMRTPPKKKFNTPFLDKWDPRLEPDITVYNAVLNACVQRQNWEGAFWVLQQLREKNQPPSSATYGLVMEVMLACGKFNLVHDFFKKMKKSHVPNALIYRVMLNTLWKEGKTDEAIMVVDEMEKRGIVGNAGIYYDLARCLCSAGRCDDALKQIDKICRVANKPLVVTYTGLIQTCLVSGYVENGAYIFSQMHKFCSPNLVTCNIMLKGFLDHGRYQDSYDLFVKLLENSIIIGRDNDYGDRVIPDIYTFNLMLDACLVEKKWDDLEFVYAQMLKYGHHFNSKRHLRLVLDSHRAGKEEILNMVWEHLVRMDRIPPVPLIVEMLCKKLGNEDVNGAISCLLDSCFDDLQAFSQKWWSKFFNEKGDLFKETILDDVVDKGSSFDKVAVKNLVESCKEFLLDRRIRTSLSKLTMLETGVFI